MKRARDKQKELDLELMYTHPVNQRICFEETMCALNQSQQNIDNFVNKLLFYGVKYLESIDSKNLSVSIKEVGDLVKVRVYEKGILGQELVDIEKWNLFPKTHYIVSNQVTEKATIHENWYDAVESTNKVLESIYQRQRSA